MKIAELLPHDFSNQQLSDWSLAPGSEPGQRLEWLGDRALSMALALILYRTFPERSEDELTSCIHNLCSNRQLGELGAKLELPADFELPEEDENRAASKAIADLIEARLGAIMLDAGIDAVRKSVAAMYGRFLHNPPPRFWGKSAKTLLSQKCIRLKTLKPKYTARRIDDGFEASCRALAIERRGRGHTRVEAEQEAAEAILKQLNIDQGLEG